MLSGWTDNDSSGSLNHAGSQSQSPMGSKQNVFFDHRTVVHDTMAHPDDSMLSTGTDVDVEDDSPLLSGIGMSSGELKQALYVSLEELSTMRVTQKSLRNSYRKLEPCVMELMQAYNHVNTQVSVSTSTLNTTYVVATIFNASSNTPCDAHYLVHFRAHSPPPLLTSKLSHPLRLTPKHF